MQGINIKVFFTYKISNLDYFEKIRNRTSAIRNLLYHIGTLEHIRIIYVASLRLCGYKSEIVHPQSEIFCTT
jgi:hypothetical protein